VGRGLCLVRRPDGVEGAEGHQAFLTRTIRRDLDALHEARFGLFDDKIDGKACWKLTGHPFKALAETGFTLSYRRVEMTYHSFASTSASAFPRPARAMPIRAMCGTTSKRRRSA
jgi:hypothetical protein